MQGSMTFSQSGEDVILDFLIRHVLRLPTVVYLDVGCNDPVHLNNTYAFYLQGHRGVCVDPNPRFRERYESERPGDAFLQSGVGPVAGSLDFFVIDPHTLSTFSQAEADRYVRDGHFLVETTQVPVVTLHEIVAQLPHELAPNLLSLDVEGNDEGILATLRESSWRPAVVCAETLTYTTDSSEQKVQSVIDLMASLDYRVYADTYINTIFVDEGAWRRR